ncbi:MAG TPA: anti-sigma factor [Alcaligenes sp.]|nr:anti-sigma factor [Alcaligenes sp.]HRL28324.1 anti-sigma factor [Alcaligenes sp.]
MPSSTFSYSSSLTQLAAQDALALDLLYDQEAPPMLALGQTVLGRRIDAEEVLRDTFVLLWKNAASYDPDLGPARAWIYSILRFRLIARLRQRSNRQEAATALPAIQPRAGQVFIPAMGQLDGTTQRAMICAYLHGNHYEQLGASLNRSPAQLRALVQQGLQQLSPFLGVDGALDPRHALLIGEYTLGLLSQHELAQAHTLMQENDDAARLTLAWEQAWLELVDCLTPVSPAPTSLAHVHQTLGLPPPAPRRPAGQADLSNTTAAAKATSLKTTPAASRQEPSIAQKPSAQATPAPAPKERAEPRWDGAAKAQLPAVDTPPFPTLLRADPEPQLSTTQPSSDKSGKADAPTVSQATVDKRAYDTNRKATPQATNGSDTQPAAQQEPVRRRSRLSLPVMVACAALLVAIGLGIALAFAYNAEPPVTVIEMKPRQAAILQAPGQSSTPAWIVTVDPQGNMLLIPKVRTEVKQGQAVQLWTHSPRAAQIRSLGLIDPNRPITVPASLIGTLEDEQILEMTLESDGGSDSGSPEGPVLYIGSVVSFGQLDSLPTQQDARPAAHS